VDTCHNLILSLELLFEISNILSLGLGTSKTWLWKEKNEKQKCR